MQRAMGKWLALCCLLALAKRSIAPSPKGTLYKVTTYVGTEYYLAKFEEPHNYADAETFCKTQSLTRGVAIADDFELGEFISVGMISQPITGVMSKPQPARLGEKFDTSSTRIDAHIKFGNPSGNIIGLLNGRPQDLEYSNANGQEKSWVVCNPKFFNRSVLQDCGDSRYKRSPSGECITVLTAKTTNVVRFEKGEEFCARWNGRLFTPTDDIQRLSYMYIAAMGFGYTVNDAPKYHWVAARLNPSSAKMVRTIDGAPMNASIRLIDTHGKDGCLMVEHISKGHVIAAGNINANYEEGNCSTESKDLHALCEYSIYRCEELKNKLRNCHQLSISVPVATTPAPSPEHPLTRIQQVIAIASKTIGCLGIIIGTSAGIGVAIMCRQFGFERLLIMAEEATLLIAHCFVLTMRGATEPVSLCKWVSFTLHWMFLSHFAFILYDAVHCCSYVIGMRSTGSPIKKNLVFIVCLAVPLAYAIITAAVLHSDLPSNFTCWLNYESKFVWILGIPITTASVVVVIICEAASGMDYFPLPLVPELKMAGIKFVSFARFLLARVNQVFLFFIGWLDFAHYVLDTTALHYQGFGILSVVVGVNIATGVLFFARSISANQAMYKFCGELTNKVAGKMRGSLKECDTKTESKPSDTGIWAE